MNWCTARPIHSSARAFPTQGTVPKVRPEYMNKLNRRECSTIIKIRSRMIPAKSNMMASHNNQICRICNDESETQEHILAECKEINLDKKIEYKKAFNNNDMEALKTIAEKNKRNHRPPREDPKSISSPTGWATRRSGPMHHYYYYRIPL